MASSVIQATRLMEFDDGLRTREIAGALVVATSNIESISNPPGDAGCSWVGCGCHKDPISDKIITCLVPRIGSIELQLLYGVRIELA